MSTDYWPFDSGLGADSFEDRWRTMGRWWIGDGPIRMELDEFAVFANASGLEVHVPSGRAWVGGHAYEETAQTDVPLDPNTSGDNRIDRIVIRADLVARTVGLAVLKGTPGASPVPPPTTKSSTVWEVPLAQVAVDDGAVSIAAADVTDERPLQTVNDEQVRIAGADMTLTSEATTQVDDELYAWLEPNTRYEIDAAIIYRGPDTGDFKWRFTGPTAAVGRHSAICLQVGASSDTALQSVSDDLSTSLSTGARGTGAGSYRLLHVIGHVETAADGGLLQFRWAQDTSDGGNTIRKAGSRLTVRRSIAA